MPTNTEHITVGDLADHAAHAIRELNHRTHPGIGDPAGPSEAAEIIAALADMTDMLPQLLDQLARWLERQNHDGRLNVDELTALPDPAQTVHALTGNLQHATHCLQDAAEELHTAHEHAAHLSTPAAPDRGQNSCRSVGPSHLTKRRWSARCGHCCAGYTCVVRSRRA